MPQKQQVYMILYQYCYKDYSVIATMTTLEKAYKYICNKHHPRVPCKLVELLKDENDDDKCVANSMNILYCNQFDYYNLETYNVDHISPFMIISMNLR